MPAPQPKLTVHGDRQCSNASKANEKVDILAPSAARLNVNPSWDDEGVSISSDIVAFVSPRHRKTAERQRQVLISPALPENKSESSRSSSWRSLVF